MHQLDPTIKAIWSISYLLRFIFYTIVIFVLEYLFVRTGKTDWFFDYGITTILVLIFGIVVIIVMPQLKYRFWQFAIREEEIYIERGVFTRIKTTAPFKRLQHLDVEQSVLDRMFGLSKLVIYTAGTRGADLVIPGLPLPYSEMLRDQLKNYTGEDAV